MAASSLLVLIDDIAAVLDDVAVMSKTAAQKTAGVLGDDLALNAQQVQGVRAERELPVVWAVAKGSFKNKLILVPAALLISAFLPILMTILLMIGGAYLCFEGAEKVVHKLLHADSDEAKQQKREAIADPSVDLVAMEQEKIKGAIRTDFILSAEIIVIAMGTVQQAAMAMQVAVISALAVLLTIGVYGLVAGIVKLDDAGLYLIEKSGGSGFQHSLGRGLLAFAPKLMKFLAVAGTIAMFLVGGGILWHGLPFGHTITEAAVHWGQSLGAVGGIVAAVIPVLFNLIAGVVAGLLVLLVVEGVSKLKG